MLGSGLFAFGLLWATGVLPAWFGFCLVCLSGLFAAAICSWFLLWTAGSDGSRLAGLLFCSFLGLCGCCCLVAPFSFLPLLPFLLSGASFFLFDAAAAVWGILLLHAAASLPILVAATAPPC